jgi:hypothetical protein
MKTLLFWLGLQVIVIAPVPFSRLSSFQFLTEELTKTWENLGGDTALLLANHWTLLQQIADLFPRLDTPPQPIVYGWDVSLMEPEDVQLMFLCQIEGDGKQTQAFPSKLLALHQSEFNTTTEVAFEPQEGDDIENWNPPIKSCGDFVVDTIGQLTAATSVQDTLLLYDRFDLGTINLLVQAYNASQESPEDRRKQYLADSYKKYKEQNADIINKALGLDTADFDLTKMFADIPKNPEGKT